MRKKVGRTRWRIVKFLLSCPRWKKKSNFWFLEALNVKSGDIWQVYQLHNRIGKKINSVVVFILMNNISAIIISIVCLKIQCKQTQIYNIIYKYLGIASNIKWGGVEGTQIKTVGESYANLEIKGWCMFFQCLSWNTIYQVHPRMIQFFG